ncbi:hypothetical protein CSX00_09370 [Pseudobutyrivibrio ruminis]|uniref:Uncharacterized protein n=1 Tax=Pseudobutyrivibrio ruminis TaxID=46206 RepID=A0A2G3E9J0_9FIRM|nr:hypothetical protein [Pseudobutyrivibrio ruminis]PHU39763.1 hypothetical protein CSX00_09370 [Pseudobutyrivibrio ruminis]
MTTRDREEEVRREAFREFLYDLARPEKDLLASKTDRSTVYKKLEKIYGVMPDGNEFRHYYSDIFSVLSTIKNNPEKGSIDIVGLNLDRIKRGYNPEISHNDVSKYINKLYDHVSLEMARLSYTDSIDWRGTGEERVRAAEEKIEGIENISKELVSKFQEQKSSIEKQQRDYIAILGIFAAIVLAFTGGIAFSTSVLNNINCVSPYRLIIIVLVIGVVLINTLYCLFYYIDRLAIRANSKTIKPIIIANAILLFLLIATIVAWRFGWIEYRNHLIL